MKMRMRASRDEQRILLSKSPVDTTCLVLAANLHAVPVNRDIAEGTHQEFQVVLLKDSKQTLSQCATTTQLSGQFDLPPAFLTALDLHLPPAFLNSI